MGDLRTNLLRQQLQRELNIAKKLEAEGKHKAAAAHYSTAGSIYRRLGYAAPTHRAEEYFQTANQYDNLASNIRNPEKIEAAKDISQETYMEAIESLIVTTRPETTWDDIGGLAPVKTNIKEAIIIPFINEKPPYVRSPRTILLYGPPGTGKTLLAKASSHTLDATFFEAKGNTLLSKYFGESSKLINALFSKSRKMQPSVIFIDEIDSLAIARSGNSSEAGRRVLGQILTEIDGFNTSKEDKVLIMGATNKPWDLDEAIVSRFQKRIYVPLPDDAARKSIIRIHLKGAEMSGLNMDELVRRTKGFSGRDIANLCQDAVMGMVREMNPNLEELDTQQLAKYALKSRPLTMKDFEDALEETKPAVQDLDRYEEWKREFGG